MMMMIMTTMNKNAMMVFGFTTTSSSLRLTCRPWDLSRTTKREAAFAIHRHHHARLFMTTTNNRNNKKQQQQEINGSSSTSLSLSSSSPPPPLIFAPSAYYPNQQQQQQQHHPQQTPVFPIRTVAAPMVAACDYAFRCLVRQHSHVDACFTQMLHARNILQCPTFLKHHLDLYEYNNISNYNYNDYNHLQPLLPVQQAFLEGSQQNESLMAAAAAAVHHGQSHSRAAAQHGPVIVQLAGHDPAVVVQAAQVILEQQQLQQHTTTTTVAAAAAPNNNNNNNSSIAGFDLNYGCPQAIARKGKYGGFLMEQDNGVAASRILAALRQALPQHITVSAKIRLPLQDGDLPDRMQRLVEIGGVDFLTIHGRTLHENKTNVRACHTDRIQQAIQWAHHFNPNLPVIANGGVEFLSDVSQRLMETGASAIMSSEALLETPNVFAVDSSQHSPRGMLEQQFQMTRDYLAWCVHFPPLPGVLGQGGSLNIARGHVFKMLHRYFQEQVDLRDQLASSHNNNIKTLVQLWELVDTLYERYVDLTDDDLADLSSAQPDSSWYRRHWKANARVHQRERPGAVLLLARDGGRGVNGNDNNTNDSLSLEERKALVRERIAKLQRQKRNVKLPVD